MRHNAKEYPCITQTPLPNGWEKLYRRIIREQIMEDLRSQGIGTEQVHRILECAVKKQEEQR